MARPPFLVALILAVALAGCANTIRGAGQDAHATGQAIEDAVQP